MTPLRDCSCSCRVCSVLITCVPPLCTLRQLTIKICFGNLDPPVSFLLPEFYPNTFYIYSLFPLNLKYNEERNPVVPILLGVQLCEDKIG